MIKSIVSQGFEAHEIVIEAVRGKEATASNQGAIKFHSPVGPIGKKGVGRIRHAIIQSGFVWPDYTVDVSFRPGDRCVNATSPDLAIALKILEMTGQIRLPDVPIYCVGELGLDGSCQRCNGAIILAESIPVGSIFLFPKANEPEVALVRSADNGARKYIPLGVENLRQVAEMFQQMEEDPERLRNYTPEWRAENYEQSPPRCRDMNTVRGMLREKRAMEIAAAGEHAILMIGPPGEGKSLLANALPGILPELNLREIVELTKIYSLKGILSGNQIVTRRPFRGIGTTATKESIIGGGSGIAMPGEISLAHHGVLFLDEIVEFGPSVLESLRGPLQDRYVSISRKDGTAKYPCSFFLVAAMNPSRSSTGRADASEDDAKYMAKLSRPMRDRIDLQLRVVPLTGEESLGVAEPGSSIMGDSSDTIRRRVEVARKLQEDRFRDEDYKVNSRISNDKIQEYCQLEDESVRTVLMDAKDRIETLSTRKLHSIFKVSRTIADLANSSQIQTAHIIEAVELSGDRRLVEYVRRRRTPDEPARQLLEGEVEE